MRLADVRYGHRIRDLTLGYMVAKQAEKHGDRIYLTVLPDGKGSLAFRPDTYGRDRRIA